MTRLPLRKARSKCEPCAASVGFGGGVGSSAAVSGSAERGSKSAGEVGRGSVAPTIGDGGGALGLVKRRRPRAMIRGKRIVRKAPRETDVRDIM